jgi:hypothetical protein
MWKRHGLRVRLEEYMTAKAASLASSRRSQPTQPRRGSDHPVKPLLLELFY